MQRSTSSDGVCWIDIDTNSYQLPNNFFIEIWKQCNGLEVTLLIYLRDNIEMHIIEFLLLLSEVLCGPSNKL